MANGRADETVVILAPVGQDAAALASTLQAHNIPANICRQPGGYLDEFGGAFLLTEEALELPGASKLLERLKSQPAWSELPVIILTSGGESRTAKLLDLAASAAGSVTLLERPMSPATLLRSVQVALRARRRQYQVRDLIEEQQRTAFQLRQSEEALRRSEEVLREHATNLERAVNERTAALRATNEQLETYVYSVAHDLRAPLRFLSGGSQLLLDDYAAVLDSNGQQLLRRIQGSAEFMDRLLLDLLDYGRASRAEIELGPVRVRKAWDSALFQCATQIEQTHARVEAAEPLPTVLAHEGTLGQVFANLLSNSLKFVVEGVHPHVRLWAEERGPLVRLSVRDNGLGIPNELHERVFRVFERLHGERFPGTGIGLSIAKKSVERMGGRLMLESEPGNGSTFRVELRRA